MRRLFIFALLSGAAFAAATGYSIVKEIKIGGDNSWDYLTMDSAARRLYVSHNNSVAVVDPGPFPQLGREPREPRRPDRPQLVDRRGGPVRVARRDDAGPGPGGLLPEVALVHQGDPHTLARQEVGRRQADDTAADD